MLTVLYIINVSYRTVTELTSYLVLNVQYVTPGLCSLQAYHIELLKHKLGTTIQQIESVGTY